MTKNVGSKSERTKLSTLIFSFRALHDQQSPKILQIKQKPTNVPVLRKNSNGILMEVTNNSGAFAKQCPQSFNDLPIITRSDVVLSFSKVTVKPLIHNVPKWSDTL